MRLILILWAIPLVLFWGWYGLSAYDINFGFFFMSRDFNLHMMGLYGQILNVEPASVPGLIAGVFAFDTAILLGIAALRWYKSWLPQTISWIKARFAGSKDETDFGIGSAPAMFVEAPKDYVEPGIDEIRPAVRAELAHGAPSFRDGFSQPRY